MARYLFLFLSGGRMIRSEGRELENDAEAIELGHSFSAGADIEVWQHDCRVVQIEYGNMTPAVLAAPHAPAQRRKGYVSRQEQLRAKSRLYTVAAKEEGEPCLKQSLAQHAFALAQLAEKIERAEIDRGQDRKLAKPAQPKVSEPWTPLLLTMPSA